MCRGKKTIIQVKLIKALFCLQLNTWAYLKTAVKYETVLDLYWHKYEQYNYFS